MLPHNDIPITPTNILQLNYSSLFPDFRKLSNKIFNKTNQGYIRIVQIISSLFFSCAHESYDIPTIVFKLGIQICSQGSYGETCIYILSKTSEFCINLIIFYRFNQHQSTII